MRASKIPLAMLCPQSLHEPALKIEGDDAAARMGTAVHEWLAVRIDPSHGPSNSSARTIACKYAVDPDECERLCWQAWRMWEQLAEHFPVPETEVAMRGLSLSGSVDVLSVVNL